MHFYYLKPCRPRPIFYKKEYELSLGEAASGEGCTTASALPIDQGEGASTSGGVGPTEAADDRRIFHYPRLSLSRRLAAQAQARVEGGVSTPCKAMKRPASTEPTSGKRPRGSDLRASFIL